jgi:hypothetical protein
LVILRDSHHLLWLIVGHTLGPFFTHISPEKGHRAQFLTKMPEYKNKTGQNVKGLAIKKLYYLTTF